MRFSSQTMFDDRYFEEMTDTVLDTDFVFPFFIFCDFARPNTRGHCEGYVLLHMISGFFVRRQKDLLLPFFLLVCFMYCS